MTWVVDTDDNGKQKLKSEDDLRKERIADKKSKQKNDANAFKDIFNETFETDIDQDTFENFNNPFLM